MGKIARPEEIIAKLRAVEVRLSQSEMLGLAIKSIGVAQHIAIRRFRN